MESSCWTLGDRGGCPRLELDGCEHAETGGSSGDGWFRGVDGETVLVSNTSIGPFDNTWPAGPQPGKDAQALCRNMSETYGGR